jgi:hypothetical protein
MLGDLFDEVWRLRGQDILHTRTKEEGGKDAIIAALQVQLKEKNDQIQEMKGKYDNVVCLLVVFVFGLVAGKMLM